MLEGDAIFSELCGARANRGDQLAPRFRAAQR
jgi:hypothetical protein